MYSLCRPSKRNASLLCSGALFLAGSAVAAPGGASAPYPLEGNPISPPSAEATSFDEVAARLDRGGSFYLYLSTNQWLEGLSGQLSTWRDAILTEEMSPEDRRQAKQAFDIAAALIKQSGIEQINGVGFSSLALEPGVYRNVSFIHHDKGKETGFLNTLLGTSPHPLDGLNLLPANTALASSGDYDIAGLVRAILKVINQSGSLELKKHVAEGIEQFENASGMKLDEFLSSFGGQMDLILTLDPTRQIDIPMGPGKTQKIPTPRLALLIGTKDDQLFSRLDGFLGGLPQINRTDEAGLKMRTMPYPLPNGFEVRPTLAQWDKFLVLASDDRLLRDIITAQKSGTGYRASAAFAKISAGLPTEGNGFTLVTKTLGDLITHFQEQALKEQPGTSPQQAELFRKLVLASNAGDAYTVTAHVENGWLSVGKAGKSVTQAMVPLMIVPIAIAAGASVPVFNKVSEKGKATKSLAQARQIALACKLYASDNNGKFPESLADLFPTYLNDKKILVSPFEPTAVVGYKYHAGLTDESPADTILLEDMFAPANQRVVVHVDTSGEVLHGPPPPSDE